MLSKTHRMIGEKSRMLFHGGQLHHLAFAGPIYDNSSKCLILDEPISALDDKTSVEILLN